MGMFARKDKNFDQNNDMEMNTIEQRLEVFRRVQDTARGGAVYLYLISILIWPHFDTYPYISIQNILMSTQNILIIKIYLRRGFLSKNIQRGGPLEQNVNFSSTCFYII